MKHRNLILTIRFTGYLLFFIGLIAFVFMLGPLFSAELKYRTDRIFKVKRTAASISKGREFSGLSSKLTFEMSGPTSFNNVTSSENQIVPVSTDFGIVIEKINANAKIIPNVDAGNEKQYVTALTEGVAQALGSTPPGQPGNLYLFSHSVDAPWNIIRFNAIFYLLRELDKGDKVVIFYKEKRYDYIVFDKTVVLPNDISFLTNKYDAPVLTLQTCDPPGTLLNRLIVRAKLVSS